MWTSSATYQPAAPLIDGNTYEWQVQVKDSADGYLGVPNVSGWTTAREFTVSLPPVHPDQSTSGPVDESVVSTLNPDLSVVIPANHASEYQFRVTTGADGVSGVVVSSGWFSATAGQTLSWPLPDGIVTNGGSYTWGVMARTGTDVREPDWFSASESTCVWAHRVRLRSIVPGR